LNLKLTIGWTAFLSLLSLFISMANQVIVSYHFGTSSQLDAYWVAFAVMNFLAFPLTPLREALVPEVHRYAQISPQVASEYFSKALSLILLIAFIGAAVGVIFSSAIFDWFEEKNNAVIRIQEIRNLMWLAPAVILLALSDTLNSLLTSYNRVVLQTLYRLFAAGASTATIALVTGWLGSFVLVIGFIVGQLISIIFLIRALRKEGLRFWFALPWGLGKNFLHLSGVLIVSYALSQIYSVYEKTTFVNLSSGLVSAFQYAVSITNVVITVIGFSIANVLWPRFLKHSANENHQQMHQELIITLKAVFLLLGGICASIFILAPSIVAILFKRGSFDQAAVEITTHALKAAVFAAIPISLGAVIGKVLISRGKSKSLMTIGLITALFGMAILCVAKMNHSADLAMSHWVLANTLGTCFGFVFVIPAESICLSGLLKLLLWMIRLVLSCALACTATYIPTLIFQNLSEPMPIIYIEVILKAVCFFAVYGVSIIALGLLNDFSRMPNMKIFSIFR